MRKVLVVAAHPDDEVLGCGGTVLRHVAEGDVVHTMILAEGVTSRDEKRNVDSRQKELEELHKTAHDVAKFMGVEKVILCSFPDNRMDQVVLLDVIKRIEKEMDEYQPDIVYTHHAGDVNIDHRIAHEAVVAACRSMPGKSVRTVLFFETMSSTEWQIMTGDKVFLPNWYVDIGAFYDRKMQALKFYKSEMRPYPHPRSYEAVEIWGKQRGITIGVCYAEAFELGRQIRM